jgi:small subunit ribosomal protein S9
MADEEREGQVPEEGAEQAGEQAPGADQPTEADQPAEAEQPAEAQQPAEAKEASEPEPAAEPEQAGEPEQPEAGAPEPEAAKEGAKPDQPPGAELEPIAIESDRELGAEERARLEAEAEERARREAEATAEEPADAEAPRKAAIKLEGDTRVTATGKRKSSIARVILLPGDGKVTVNRRELDAYFPRSLHQSIARQPLVATGYDANVDVQVRVHGGGISGQAGAVRHGIARALVEVDPELRRELKRRGYLTRDARRKERRKAGLKKARKRPQFSKR